MMEPMRAPSMLRTKRPSRESFRCLIALTKSRKSGPPSKNRTPKALMSRLP